MINILIMEQTDDYVEVTSEKLHSENQSLLDEEDPQAENINNFLTAVMMGNSEELQKFFVDTDDHNNEKTTRLLNTQDNLGKTALHLASQLGHCEIITMLVKLGANVNMKTVRGYTPLHCAAAWGKLESIKTLVELGADIQEKTFRGEKAQDIAHRYSKTDCAEYLDWAEAKLMLELYISNIQETVADPTRLQAKLTKQEKTACLNACRVKSDWLQSSQNVPAQEFMQQKEQLEMTLESIFSKILTACSMEPVADPVLHTPIGRVSANFKPTLN
ncbi:ankyrin repeat domain-containing protein 45 isoform X3 [Callorhinchus milii]|uniref:ankyrin repeat domain-containing protein 45 isoform X3 n=1 Tax=Callorhinchus milii TaxID=7868 RepID=UPI0004572505|nr:ankyrin repeat domain-containing protein 45 isoform X3 [Callorhinchus milii]|eukprot:gi/632969611/ref/XP_007901175.1/ PREDICTED: ankyrin repeat domain-containing protein 45 isoform X3 [Callorhinchus milii]